MEKSHTWITEAIGIYPLHLFSGFGFINNISNLSSGKTDTQGSNIFSSLRGNLVDQVPVSLTLKPDYFHDLKPSP